MSVTATLDPALHARLERLAAARGGSAAALLGEAVAQYVEREEARERMRADAREAWADYQVSGRHASGEAVDAWLARLEAGEASAPPSVASRP
jgi:predicted transcriptional regulator